jgi:hypothetical protein
MPTIITRGGASANSFGFSSGGGIYTFTIVAGSAIYPSGSAPPNVIGTGIGYNNSNSLSSYAAFGTCTPPYPSYIKNLRLLGVFDDNSGPAGSGYYYFQLYLKGASGQAPVDANWLKSVTINNVTITPYNTPNITLDVYSGGNWSWISTDTSPVAGLISGNTYQVIIKTSGKSRIV